MQQQETLNEATHVDRPPMQEITTVTSPGARASAWAVKVKGLVSYNVYNVAVVILGVPGALPAEIGQHTQAINLAEPFMQQGTLPAGTYAIMFRFCDKNIFHVKP